jgi:hypothetical protein
MKFANFLWYTYNSVAPISWAKVDSKLKVVEEFTIFPNEFWNFTDRAKFLIPTSIWVEGWSVRGSFPEYFEFFQPLPEILQEV